MKIEALSTYRPAWDAEAGRRACGPDEDVVTLAVAAALPVVAGRGVRRVVLVTRELELLEASTGAVVLAALRLPATTPVEERLGGGPAALAALAAAAPGTLVIAVSPAVPAGSAAALAGADGLEVEGCLSVEASLPARVRHAGLAEPAVYDDPRLVRERGTRPAVSATASGTPPVAVTGVAKAELRRFGVEDAVIVVPVGGAAEPFFALAALLRAARTGRLVAVEGASSTGVDVRGGGARVVHTEARPASPQPAKAAPARIPLSLAAYARAFDAKVGLRAARCACGTLNYPPRRLCFSCGSSDGTSPEDLPRTGEVYTTVTVHTPVPGLPSPYSLAIVSLDGVDVRVLAHVTGTPAGSVRIGDRGELALRRVALREGVPDYGYGFAPVAS